MIVKANTTARIIGLIAIILFPIAIIEKIIAEIPFTLQEWLLLIFYPFLLVIACFILQTLRITLSDKGINVYWKIGFGSLIIWEQKNYRLRWSDVGGVFSHFSAWLPFHFIGVVGVQGEKMRKFYLGTYMTNKKKSLLYLADHLHPDIFDEDTKKLIEKYRKQLAQKARTS